MRRLLQPAWFALFVVFCAAAALGQQAGQIDGPMPQTKQQTSPQPAAKKPEVTPQKQLKDTPPPRSDDESSSETERLDLSPPKSDDIEHPDSGRVADRVLKQHEWNPMRCMKDVEVGDYYMKAGNLKAALSRYREALLFKPRDAVATYKLALALEKLKLYDEARERYEEYLDILKDGPQAAEVRKALARLPKP